MTDHQLVETSLFPLRRPDPVAVPQEYRNWAAEGPVRRVRLRTGDDAVIVLRYEDAKQLLDDKSLTSHSRAYPHFPRLRNGVFGQDDTNLVFMDDERHLKHRRMLLPEFTPKRLATMRPELTAFVEASVDRLLASPPGPVDFCREFAVRVPSQMICVLLGVDYARSSEIFERATRAILSMDSSVEEFESGATAMNDLMTDLVQEQLDAPGPGIIGRLITSYVRTGELSVRQLIGFANLMLIAGHDTTSTQMGWGMYTLLTEPGLADTLRADPAQLPAAIEEMLRFHSISDLTMPMVARQDFAVGGEPIASGEGILVSGLAVNHDARVFPDPDVFDHRRQGARHLSFSFGAHACMGQNLARLELEIAYRTVLERIPSLRLAVDPSEVEVNPSAMVRQLAALPVTWDR